MKCISEMLKGLDASDWIAILAAIIGLASFGLSLWNAIKNQLIEHDRELLRQLVLSLERAYSAISPSQANLPPNPDRLAWLTSARHLVSYEDLKNSLRLPLYKRLCEEQEEFWRHEFYLLILRIGSEQYFSSINAEEMMEENIEPTSAARILAFSAWPEGRPDPIDSLSLDDLVARNNLFSPRFRHFRNYIERRFPNIYARITRDS